MSFAGMGAGAGALGASVESSEITDGTITVADLGLSADVESLLDDASLAAMRTTMSLVPGTDIQAYDAQLALLAAFTSADVYRLKMLALNSGAILGANVTNVGSHAVIDGGKTVTKGTLYLTRVPVFEGQLITSVAYNLDGNTVAESAGNGVYGAVFEANSASPTPRALIQQSAEVIAWTANTIKEFTLASTITVSAAQAAIGYLWAGFWADASFVGTAPDVMGLWAHYDVALQIQLGGTSNAALQGTAPAAANAPTQGYQTVLWAEFR